MLADSQGNIETVSDIITAILDELIVATPNELLRYLRNQYGFSGKEVTFYAFLSKGLTREQYERLPLDFYVSKKHSKEEIFNQMAHYYGTTLENKFRKVQEGNIPSQDEMQMLVDFFYFTDRPKECLTVLESLLSSQLEPVKEAKYKKLREVLILKLK